MPRTLFTDAVLVAAVPAGVLLFAYCYEFGYATAFKMPLQLVAVTWGNAVLAGTVIFVFIALWFILTYGVVPESPVASSEVELILSLAYMVMYTVLVYGKPTMWLFVPVDLFIFLGLLAYIVPHLRGKYTVERLIEISKNRRRRIGRNPLYYPALLLGAGVLLFFQLGKYRASHQAEFYVRPTPPETTLLATYGDTYVFGRFDERTKTLGDAITILKLADGSSLTLEKERVGPLKPPVGQ